MHNKVFVHIIDSLTDLPYKEDAVSLCEVKVIFYHTLKQFTTSYAENRYF